MRVAVHDYAGHPFPVELSRELARRGHDVLHLYSTAITSPRGALARTERDAPNFSVEGINLPTNIDRNRLVARRRLEWQHGLRVSRRLRGFRPEVVISANAPLESQRLIAESCTRNDAAFVFWVQDLIGEAATRLLRRRLRLAGLPVARYYQRLEQRLLKRADAVVVISADFQSHVPPGAHVIENWAPLRDLPVRPKANDWSRAHGLADTLTLLYSGTLGMKHDPSLLLEIAVAAAPYGGRVVVASEGYAATWLEEQARDLPSRNLEVLPFQPYDDLPDMLATGDVLVAILEPDAGVFSVPSKVLSYLCAQRPLLLVVPPENLAARIVSRARAGIVQDPGERRSLHHAVEQLVTDPATREQMGARGRAYAEEAFDLEAITTRFEVVLDEAAAGRARRSALHPSRREPTPSRPSGATEPAPALVDLSVVIVSYNSRATLARCLASLDAERGTVALEAIVVDNASADETAGLVEAEFPWVRLVRNTSNVGFARAANAGLAVAAGRNILLLNPDTVLPPGTLPAALAELETRPEYGMLGCKLVREDGTFDHACKRGLPTVASAFYYLVGLHRLFPRNPQFAAYVAGHVDEDAEAAVDAVNGAFMLVRGDALSSVGGLDERFWLYGEDLDWCERFAEHGWKILYWPTVRVTHLKGASGRSAGGRTWKTNVAFHRSMWLYYEKHLSERRPRLLSALVWTGIWSRCLATGAAMGVRTAAGSRREL